MSDNKYEELFIEMMNLMCIDPADNPGTLKNDMSMKSNYIIYSAIHHLIKIYDLLNSAKNIKYNISIIYNDKEDDAIIELIKRYIELYQEYKLDIVYHLEYCEFKIKLKDTWR